MINIIDKLNANGISIKQTDRFYRGYYTTDKGIVVSAYKSKCTDGIYFLSDDKGNIYPCNDRIVYIVSGTEYEGKVTTKAEVESLAKDGKILSFKSSDLYREYYNLNSNEDLSCCFKYGYSAASRAYIKSVMSKIGLVNYTDDISSSMSDEGNPTKFDVVCTHNIFLNGDTDIGKISSDLWLAQTCYRVDIDDYGVIKMYFDHRPSIYDIRQAYAIKRFEAKPIEVFRCWECGHLTNWLDLSGDIIKRRDMAEDSYCGC